MKTRWVVLLMAALAVSLLACRSANPNEVGEFKPYINTEYGFRVEYPSNWQVVIDPASLVGDKPDKVHAMVFLNNETSSVLFTVLVQRVDGATTLADFGKEQIAGARSNAGTTVLSDLAPAKLGGVDALITQATVDQSGQTVAHRLFMAVKGQRGYLVSLSAPENSLLKSTLDDMLASFRFLP